MTHQKKRLILIITSICLIFIVMPVVIFVIIKPTQKIEKPTDKTIVIDNKSEYSSNINSDVFTRASVSAYNLTSLNINNAKNYYHGVIRNGTMKSVPNSSVSFILDIPSIKVSWFITQGIDTTNTPNGDTSVICVTKQQAIYPLLNDCIDANSGFRSQEQNGLLKIAKELPLTGPTYKIDSGLSSTDKSFILVVTFYTSTGKQDALDAIKSLGYNPEDYSITYIDGLL